MPTLLPPQCSFCGWSPKSIHLYLHNSAILNLSRHNPQKTYRTFSSPNRPLKKHLSPANPLVGDPTADGFSRTSMATRPPSTKACAMAAAPEASWESHPHHCWCCEKVGCLWATKNYIQSIYIYRNIYTTKIWKQLETCICCRNLFWTFLGKGMCDVERLIKNISVGKKRWKKQSQ